MRIAHIAVEIVPAENGAFVGGLAKNIVAIAEAQRKSGHEVHVFTTDVRERLRDDSLEPHGWIHRVATRGTYGSPLFAATFMTGTARRMRRAQEREPLDLVHIHSAYSTFAGFAHLLGGMKVRKVFSLYSPNFRAVPGHDCNAGRHRGRDFLARQCLRPYDAFVAPSRNLVGRLQNLHADGIPVVRVPPALDPGIINGRPSREEARQSLELPEDRPVLLFLGNYASWKGADLLLEAFKRVRRKHSEALLLTAWGEPYNWPGNRRPTILSRIRALGLENAVRQVGIVPDVRRLFRATDALVSPFRCTCKVLDYPLSILEGMACGTPVISTRVGGIPELLAMGRGIGVPPGSVVDLVEAIEIILEDPDSAREMASDSALWARDHFAPEKVIRELDSVYASVRGGRFGSPESVRGPTS